MMLFFLSRYVIHKLLEDKRECDISIINELYDQQNQRMQSTISCKDYNNKDMKLDHILKSMEFLQDERERLMRASKRAYDFKDMFIFISSFLLPFVTTYILPLIMPKINQ